MSTRSFICIEQSDRSWKGIYCHHDGYPEYNGKMLVKNYTTKSVVEQLLALGDISSLGQSPAEGTIAYGRDYQQTGDAATTVTIESALDTGGEYIYVFGNDGKWRYVDLIRGGDDSLSPIPIPECDGYYEDLPQADSSIDFDSLILGI